MLSLPRILAPIDFSERSPGAARYAGGLAGSVATFGDGRLVG